jgi:hypothetical protein
MSQVHFILLSQKFPQDPVFVVGVAPRGTFNTDTVIDWIRTSFRAVRQRLHATGHGVLALDSYGCHLHDDVSL